MTKNIKFRRSKCEIRPVMCQNRISNVHVNTSNSSRIRMSKQYLECQNSFSFAPNSNVKIGFLMYYYVFMYSFFLSFFLSIFLSFCVSFFFSLFISVSIYLLHFLLFIYLFNFSFFHVFVYIYLLTFISYLLIYLLSLPLFKQFSI